MAQATPNRQPVVQQDEAYTVMLMIAAGLLLVGIIYLIVKSIQYFGQFWPAGGG